MFRFTSATLICILFLFFFLLHGCDGIFPTASKSVVPSDHTTKLGSALHKGNRDQMSPTKCGDCHTDNIQGKVSLINGEYVWANSCYQCHGNLWDRTRGN